MGGNRSFRGDHPCPECDGTGWVPYLSETVGGRFEEAFTEFVAALLLAPKDAEVLAAIGQLFLDADRAADAVAPLRRAIVVKADRFQSHYALAVALSRTGRADEAKQEFEQFERLSRQAIDERRRTVAGQ